MALVEDLIVKLLRPPRILLVEDDTVVGNRFVAKLRRGYECDLDWAYDGERAIELITRKDHDIVFLDLVLPNKNGVEVLQHIKKTKPTLPVIVVGSVSSKLLAEATGLGVVGVSSRPFTTLNFEDVFRTYGIRTLSKRDSGFYGRPTAAVPA